MTDKRESPLDRATETFYRLWLRNVMNDPSALLELADTAAKLQNQGEVTLGYPYYIMCVLSSVRETIRVIAKEMGVKGE